MKQIIAILTAFSLLVQPSAAQLGSQALQNVDFTDTKVTEAEIEIAESTFSEPGLLPDHPLYFLKRIGESIRLSLAAGEEKAKVRLEIAKTRLAEARKLIEKNRTRDAETAIREFGNEINKTEGAGILKERDAVLGKSIIVLERVLDKAPEEARPSIKAAIGKSFERNKREAAKDKEPAKPAGGLTGATLPAP